MKINNQFQNSAQPYERVVTFPDNQSLVRYTFYPEDETARLTLLSAEQSGRLERSVKALERQSLLDPNVAVIWSHWPGSLVLRGMDRGYSYLDVEIGQSFVSQQRVCLSRDWRDTIGTGLFEKLFAIGASRWLSLS
jgi:hypothetical protein